VQESARRDRLGEIGRRFLQAARALWDLGVRTLTLERVWAVVEKAGGELVAVADRSEVQRALEELAFLWVERGKRPEVARFYEGMLTEVIPSGGEWWERTAWETLQDREDAAAFMEIGNAWSEEYSPAYQRNPREALRKAIAAYGEALYFYTPDVAPLDYAKTQNDLGVAYLRLSEHEDPVGNLRRAIEAFEEVLRFRTPGVALLDYARTQTNLGTAYWRLSEYEDPVGNLQRAIEAFREALRFRTPERTPLRYAETQYGMGLAYRRRAELQTDRAQRCMDLQAAVRAFREALRFRMPKAAPRWHEETRKALEEAEEAVLQLIVIYFTRLG
jgi:tetratricopeptide (TPR) repeat protein